MENYPPVQGSLIESSNGIVPVTRGMLKERAFEIAIQDGRLAYEVSHSDWEQAKEELCSELS
jgi:hypothetical protein